MAHERQLLKAMQQLADGNGMNDTERGDSDRGEGEGKEVRGIDSSEVSDDCKGTDNQSDARSTLHPVKRSSTL